MKTFVTRQLLLLFFLTVASAASLHAQFLMDMVDTSKTMGRGMLGLLGKFENFSVTGYIQPQFQVAETKGEKSFAGGDFGKYSDNRFLLRRGRIRFDYAKFTPDGYPRIHFVFQFDGTDRGVFARDFWGRLYDTRFNLFILSAGIMPRPFSYELNTGSADRESPERGRMSQVLMKVERDLGAMLTLEPRNRNSPWRFLKIDVGVFNGQGLNPAVGATGEYDSYKDVVGRIAMKQKNIFGKLYLSAAFNMLYGGLAGGSTQKYTMSTNAAGDHTFNGDSSASHLGEKMKREYMGGDVQLKYKYDWGGATELRFEYWQGTQSAYASTTETPATLTTDPIYIRRFNGAYIYFLQHIVNKKHQLIVKYDWYDPNTEVSGSQIGKAGTTLTAADIKYSTLGFGYTYYINEHVKLLLWYDRIWNESTALAGYTADLPDDVFTCRMQFRF